LIRYEHTLRTRGYETDRTATVQIPVYLSHLEHVRWEWLLDEGSGFIPYLNEGHFFVVLRQVFSLRRRIGMGVDCEIVGQIENVGRSTVNLMHRIRRISDGALVGHARVTGAWLGPNRRLARVPDHVRESLATSSPLPPLEKSTTVGRREAILSGYSTIAPPEQVLPLMDVEVTPPQGDAPENAYRHRLCVRPSQIDIFNHVNAATWLRFMEDARILGAQEGRLPESAASPSLRVALAYEREAIVGDEIDVRVWQLPEDPLAYGVVITRGEEASLCRGRIDVLG